MAHSGSKDQRYRYQGQEWDQEVSSNTDMTLELAASETDTGPMEKCMEVSGNRKTTEQETSHSKPISRSTDHSGAKNIRLRGPGWTAEQTRGPGTRRPAPTRSQQGTGADFNSTVQ